MSFMDKVKEGLKESIAKKITLELAAGYKNIKGKEVDVLKGSSPHHLKFKTSGLMGTTVEYEIIGISWQESAKRSAGKAAAGAIIGSALTGGLGAIATGAAIGGRRKDTSTAVITFMDNGVQGTIYVRCNGKEYAELTGLL